VGVISATPARSLVSRGGWRLTNPRLTIEKRDAMSDLWTAILNLN